MIIISSFKINKTKLIIQFIGNSHSAFASNSLLGNSNLNHGCPSAHCCGAVFYLRYLTTMK
jgi:hypothetical protein